MIYDKVLNEKGEERIAGVQYFLDADCIDSVNTDPEILAKINTVSYPDGTTKSIIGPFETLLAFGIVYLITIPFSYSMYKSQNNKLTVETAEDEHEDVL